MRKQFAKLGIQLVIRSTDYNRFQEKMLAGNAQIFSWGWNADYPDAENYLALAYGPNRAPAGPNYTQFQNPRFDQLYTAALQQSNDSLRALLYQQMDALIRDEAPFMVLYYDQVLRLVNPAVTGLSTNAMNVLDLKRVKMAHHPQKDLK
jgi:ABC-type transport system substrate-binding protein